MAQPCRKRWTGKSKAATVPPALKRAHRSGVFVFAIYPRKRSNQPGKIIQAHHHRIRKTPAREMYHHRPGRKVEPGDRVEKDRGEREKIQEKKQRAPHAFEKFDISAGTPSEGAN